MSAALGIARTSSALRSLARHFSPPQRRIKYDAAIRYYRDNAHALEDAKEVGERKGWKRGHAAGVQQGFIETAKKLNAMGMSTSDIHIVMGLLPEEIDIL